MNALLKTWLYRLIGIVVSVFFVYLAVRRVDLSESLDVLGTARLPVLCAATLVYLTGIPVRALRWRLILRAQKPLSLREMLVPMTVGHMANNVLPARTGELYRAHFLGRRVRTSRSGVVGSIVVERAFDGLMLVLVIALVFFMFPGERFLGVAALFTALVFLTLAAFLLFYGVREDKTHGTKDRLVRSLPGFFRERVGVRLDSFLQGVRGISTGGELLAVGGYTALIWLIEACAVALAVMAFAVPLPLAGYVLVFALLVLGTTLPAGPGYVGPYQYAFVLALGYFAVSRETALAVSVAAQVALLGSVTVIGLALLWRENLRPPAPEEKHAPEQRSPERVG